MASTRSIAVYLRAEIADFRQKMGQAARSTEQVGESADAAGKQGQGALSKLAQSARENGAAWNAAGAALMAFGGAVVGVGALVLKTGIQYNTLQQTTRAALTTLTGSAEAANAQMDKLDEFARTSPFSKQTFIQAQQQMMAFGIETGKVLPYLDAVQNAVAAMGGSNQQISEIAYIMSQISAASKITATDLMQFGQRGIDAATLIGSQMGMTGQEIREAITAGTLDAQLALDALAAGMQETFGGAADNVKNTFEGALDRVKAAWRDFAATVAAPLVDPQGGGALVDFLNGLADGMRQFQEMPDWAQVFISGGAGIAGIMALITGAAITAIPKLLAFKTQMQTLGVTMRTAAIGFGIAAAAITALTIGLTIWATNASEARGRSRTYADAAREIGDAARQAAADVATMNIVTGETVSWGIWEQARSGYSSMADALEGLGSSAAEAGAAVAGSREDFDAYIATLDDGAFSLADVEVIAKLEEQRTALEAARTEVGRLDDAGVSLDGTQQDLAASLSGTNEQVRQQIINMWDLTERMLEAANATLSERDAQRRFEDALKSATDSIEENGKTLDITTEAGRNNEAALDGIASAGWDVINAMRENGASQDDLQSKMATTRQRFIDTAVAMGVAEGDAEALADQLGLIPSEIKTDVWVNTADATRSVQNWLNTNTNKRITVWVDAKTGAQTGFRMQGGSHLGPIGMATGGPVFGSGTSTSDDVPRMLSNNEHVLSAREVVGLGGHGKVEQLRAAARTGSIQRFANGGAVASSVAAPPVATVSTLGVVAQMSDASVSRIAHAVLDAADSRIWSSLRHEGATRTTAGVIR